jgi:hypothetical protein
MPRSNKKRSVEPEGDRDRFDLRADAVWLARVKRQAERLGLGMSGYIRLATTLKLENDEASDPGLKNE